LYCLRRRALPQGRYAILLAALSAADKTEYATGNHASAASHEQRRLLKMTKMSEQKFLPFALPDIGEDEINEVVDALRSGWVTTGPKTKQFEADFAAFIGEGVEAIAVNSATAGLHLALEAIGIQPGDEVIVPSYTFTATAEVVRYLGADPVVVDVDPATFNISPAAIRAAITPKTRAIMPVHFAGLACEMDEIIAIAREHGLKVVEDAARAADHLQGQAGGHAGFGRHRVQLLRQQNHDHRRRRHGGVQEQGHHCPLQDHASAWYQPRLRPLRVQDPGLVLRSGGPGFKYNMPDTAAAMGIHQLKKIVAFREKREVMAQRFDRELADLP
jgi:dTDP-4-amino-4,6-dideoxygalactose transaminase